MVALHWPLAIVIAFLLILAPTGRCATRGNAPPAGHCHIGEECRDKFPVYWWIWGQNNSNMTNRWAMEPLTKVQLGGHCSALTPIPERITRGHPNITSEWSEGAWPRLPQNDTASQLAKHVAALEAQLPHCVPDPHYDGLAIFDFEEWSPVWEMNNCTYLGKPVYPDGLDCPTDGWRGRTQQTSIELVRAAHPDWAESQLIEQAKDDFQRAATRFMIVTMETVKRIRPYATWGFYMFPYKLHGPCSQIVPRGKRGWVHDVRCGYDNPGWGENVSALYLADWLLPAWSSVDALFPSIYLSSGVPKDLQTAYVNENVHLALRIAEKVGIARRRSGGHDAQRLRSRPKVLPFGTLYYHGEFGPTGMVDNHTKPKPEPQMGHMSAACLSSLKALPDTKPLWVSQEQSGLMDDFDVGVQFEASLRSGADGVVLWGGGSQPYLHTDECKVELAAWVEAKLGPAVCAARQNACNSTYVASRRAKIVG